MLIWPNIFQLPSLSAIKEEKFLQLPTARLLAGRPTPACFCAQKGGEAFAALPGQSTPNLRAEDAKTRAKKMPRQIGVRAEHKASARRH